MRVALAAVLFSEPDLLLLDEPTNYLDLEGTLWLYDYLERYPRTALIISHDRDLLDTCVDHILHLDRGKLDDLPRRLHVLRPAARREARAAGQGQGQAGGRARAPPGLRRPLQGQGHQGPPGAVARQAARQDGADRRGDRGRRAGLPPAEPGAAALAADRRHGAGRRPATATGSCSSGLDLSLAPDDRIALLGANGNGKSTFCKLIGGRLGAARAARCAGPPRWRSPTSPSTSSTSCARPRAPTPMSATLMPDVPESKVRAGRRPARLPGPTKADTPVSQLSGGEKARLLMGLAAFHGPHLLILDEPTNHLDIDSRQALVEAINDYEGAVILVSHDRFLVEACADRLWLVADGTREDLRRRHGRLPPLRPVRARSARPAARRRIRRRPEGRGAPRRRRAPRRPRAAAQAARRRSRRGWRSSPTPSPRSTRRSADGTAFRAERRQGRRDSPRCGRMRRARSAAAEEEWLTVSGEIEAA